MTPLRLIILVAGLILIAVIYFWESIKHRHRQRKQTVRRSFTEHEHADVRMVMDEEPDSDYSGVLSELNKNLAEAKRKTDMPQRESVRVADPKPAAGQPSLTPKASPLPETRDMFSELENGAPDTTAGTGQALPEIDPRQIIALHVTALPGKAFKGSDIQAAVTEVGLVYGEMNIFHHYGVGEMQSDRPLFSLADMFEPGQFDLDKIAQHNTRGLTLFFCLPAGVDGQVVFELMLNTAQRLAHRLGGEIRGPDQQLIDDKQIGEIRNKINQQTH